MSLRNLLETVKMAELIDFAILLLLFIDILMNFWITVRDLSEKTNVYRESTVMRKE